MIRQAYLSLSARRAWIEIVTNGFNFCHKSVALRKESVDRNRLLALWGSWKRVALRKESVDRNPIVPVELTTLVKSLSARRAWIEIITPLSGCLM